MKFFKITLVFVFLLSTNIFSQDITIELHTSSTNKDPIFIDENNNSDETPNNPSIHNETPSGLTENSAPLLEEESTMTPEVGVFSFEGIQGDRNLISPEDPNTLPESIENPER